MSVFVNSLENTVLKAFEGQAPNHVVKAIYGASRSTGVDFAYLMQQASAESGFDPDAKAATSSASGLYQFIESTWLSMVDKHGAKYGIDKTLPKRDLLALRNDEDLAANMAAELARDNQEFLENHWGGAIGSTELYMAHFLGAGGAAAFLNARDENPLAMAADLFPAAAKSNRNVFYDKETGRGRSLAEVYDFFDKKFQIESPAGGMPAVRQDLPAVAYNALRPPSGAGGLSGFQSMVMSPVQVMMLAQLDMPFGSEKTSRLF